MSSLPSLSLIIPFYNEVERLPQMLQGIREFIATWTSDFEILLVNDFSTDNSCQLLLEQHMISTLLQDNRLYLLENKNKGKGGAIATGVAAAKMEFVLSCDADMSTSPLEIIIWQKLNRDTFSGKIISIASRTHPMSELELISNRRANGNIFNRIVRIITGLKIQDTQCGFKLYPSPIAKELFKGLRTPGWAHDVEILLRAQKANIPVVEQAIHWSEKEASKVNLFKDGLQMIWDVLKISLRR